jgi:hypothetical protein
MYAPEHTLSKKAAQQQRNVFIWSSYKNEITMGRCQLLCRIGHLTDPGWHVDTDSPTSISTVYRWITTLVQTEDPNFTPELFALFPVVIRPSNVLTYAVQPSGLALSRESQENIVPGDYGIYNEGKKVHFVFKSKRDEHQTIVDGSRPSEHFTFDTQYSYARWGDIFDLNSVGLAKKVCLFSCMIHPILSDMKQASLPSSIAERSLARDKGCLFTGATSNSDTLVATWIFPPFLGYTVSTNNAYAVTAYSSYHVTVVVCGGSYLMTHG